MYLKGCVHNVGKVLNNAILHEMVQSVIASWYIILLSTALVQHPVGLLRIPAGLHVCFVTLFRGFAPTKSIHVYEWSAFQPIAYINLHFHDVPLSRVTLWYILNIGAKESSHQILNLIPFSLEIQTIKKCVFLCIISWFCILFFQSSRKYIQDLKTVLLIIRKRYI